MSDTSTNTDTCVRNLKSGGTGLVVNRYTDRKGREMIEVRSLNNMMRKAYWLASRCEVLP